MKIIGITGSIGCGKTYLANIIKKLGFSVYNPDEWVHDLYKKADFLNIIHQEFPEAFENNVFYKRKLRNIVFDDNKQLKKLENIIHPFLKKKLKTIIKRFAKTEDIIFFDVALLYEMSWDIHCDYVIVADVDNNIQMQRVMDRDKISAEDFKKIIAVQNDKQETKEKADYVINTGLNEGINKVQLIRFISEIM